MWYFHICCHLLFDFVSPKKLAKAPIKGIQGTLHRCNNSTEKEMKLRKLLCSWQYFKVLLRHKWILNILLLMNTAAFLFRPELTCWALACSRFPRCSTSSVNVGLSVGRFSQQSNMVWYLWIWTMRIAIRANDSSYISVNRSTVTVYLHLSGGIFRWSHPGTFLKPPAEWFINANTRIRRSPWRRHYRSFIADIKWSLSSVMWLLLNLTLTQGKDLPEKDAKGPNITLRGVYAVKYGLRSHPL